MFGGTWTQIKDKFILAAGDSYSNGATGGAATVTLTVSNMPSHSHSFTPSGTVASHSHSFTPSGTVGKHSHTGPSHRHSFTPSGTVSSHSHTLNSGNTSSDGTKTTAGFRGTAHKHDIMAGSRYVTYYSEKGYGIKSNHRLTDGNYTNETGYAETHYSWASGFLYGSTDSSTPKFTGTEGNTGYAGTGNTGATQPSFTGTAGYTGSTQPSFTGTAGYTDANGSGSLFSILPPYIVKYCWERIA